MRDFGVSVVKQRRSNDDISLFPPPETRITNGDHLLVQGPYDTLKELTEYATPV